MGEPAIPSDEERAHNRAYADSVMDAVRKDLEQPLPRFHDGDAMDESTMIFKLAQEIEIARNTLTEIACDLVNYEGEAYGYYAAGIRMAIGARQ